MVRAAWDSVTAETAVNCFHRGGFSSSSEVMGSLEEDMDPDLQEQEEEEQVSLVLRRDAHVPFRSMSIVTVAYSMCQY